MQILEHIAVNDSARRPKYRQIVDSIKENIAAGHLKINAKIPSINALSERFLLSRDTVEKAYNILKEEQIITSVKGKGFYVTRMPKGNGTRVLVLINKLSAYKTRIYQSIISNLGPETFTDLHTYHCDEQLFLDALEKNSKLYDYFVVMPHFKTGHLRHASSTEKVTAALRRIPPHKLIILDNQIEELNGDCAEVYQDFKTDIYEALMTARDKITQYSRFVVTFPYQSVYPYPKRILHGFRQFCVEAKIPFEVIESIEEDRPLKKETVYLTIPEVDLVNLVKAARDQNLKPGVDIGIISYNETPLKDLLGISTVSTDFDAMGEAAAKIINTRQPKRIKNRFVFTNRNSL